MNHITALVITITAFSSGLYGIYKFVRAKYVSYDTTPIHYWSNKKQKIKKRYKSFKRRNKKSFKLNKMGSFYKYEKKYRTK